MKIILIILIMTFYGCGKSPLLNKEKEEPLPITYSQETFLEFPATKLRFQIIWITPPSVENLSSLNINFLEPLANNHQIESYIEMREHGHGSSPIVINILNDFKTVELRELAFFMTGRWTLVINIIENGMKIDTWEKDIYL